MEASEKFVVRVRALIVHEGKLLVVRHAHNPSYAALPGGHVDFGEGLHEALSRELVEELGVAPIIGGLEYVHTFTMTRDGVAIQPVEFFFAIDNSADYREHRAAESTHAHELATVEWLSPQSDARILPPQLMEDFRAGTLLSGAVRFITR